MGKTRDPLTAKQRSFARAVVAEGNQSEAYRASYNANGSKAATVNEEASRLMANPEISARVDLEHELARERLHVTVDSITEQLQSAFDTATNGGNAPAMTGASMGLAKVHGLLTDKIETITKAGDMTPDALMDELDRVRAELIQLMSPDELEIEYARVTADLSQLEVAMRGTNKPH